VAKPNFIELPGAQPIPILYEDRSVLAIDKPRGWMLVPFSWQKTSRNLQAAITSSVAGRDYWAASRGLKFLRFVHRLDAETSGILLFAKSQGALEAYSDLFEQRLMDKTYLAVVARPPKQTEWSCRLKLSPDTNRPGRIRVDARHGKEAETSFRVLQTLDRRAAAPAAATPPQNRDKSEPRRSSPVAGAGTAARLSLIEAHPRTGRTHQIRVHLAESGCPVVGDEFYGRADDGFELGLRAVRLAFADPFTRRRVEVRAPIETFCREYGFDIPRL
jgi:23S rRNA-/tRNA-specific pseudouridylate synthase